ncbi:MAG: hypothetical protein EOM20_10045 [Spartobacteria bacterium]|nr:hypothetical protein [Spartobacteria bacterium]
MKKYNWYYVATAGITAGALACLCLQPSRAASDPYAGSAGPVTQEKEGSIVPWVVGGLLVGGGAAAAIAANSGGGGGGSDDPSPSPDPSASPTPTPSTSATPTPTPTPGGGADTGCEDADAMGEWKAPEVVEGEYTRVKSFRLFAGYTASFEESTYFNPADGSPGTGSTGAFIGGWSLSQSDCMLTLSAGGSDFDGTGQIAGGTVEINGVTYTKQ